MRDSHIQYVLEINFYLLKIINYFIHQHKLRILNALKYNSYILLISKDFKTLLYSFSILKRSIQTKVQ